MEDTTQAVSSPAEVEDVFKGEQVSMAEFNKYRQDGELPERFKAVTADSAPADEPEETETEGEDPEPAPESDPDKKEQELKPKTAKRIEQLLAKNRELERQLAEKNDAKEPDSSAAKPEPQYTRQKPTAEDTGTDGKPKYETYEAFVEDLAEWKAEQRLETAKREQQQQANQQKLQKMLDDARARYSDADDVIFPAEQAIAHAQMPAIVKQVFGDSDVYVDLCYVVGSDPDELEKFIKLAQTDPRAALGKVYDYERAIREELGKPRGEDGKFVAKDNAPETKKTTAPKPPAPVGGSSSRAFDVSDESLSPDEWARKRTKDIQARRG